MPSDNIRGQGDLVLAPGQFAFVLDRTKGHVNVYVGPSKTSLSDTDQLVKWRDDTKAPQHMGMSEAIQSYPDAPEDSYIVLTNPAQQGQIVHPKEGMNNTLVPLDMGRKINVPGPASFALWPQQTAKVVKGHTLRSNQYLIVQVYNETAAKANWGNAVIKRIKSEKGDAQTTPTDPTVVELFMGQRIIIRGTDVSFYIPPTGVEVVVDGSGRYVREAVSLEQLEYAVLLSEDGAKRFIRGPAVVFPEPTETFMEIEGRLKHKAIELGPNSGIYVKVIAPYAHGNVTQKAGDELFITGQEQAIYFPRPEHAIIQYGDQMMHYAVAVPAGEGRYVLNRDTGEIRLVKGPVMLLPDPRHEVIVKRVLSPKTVELMYPGNERALRVNLDLAAKVSSASVKTAQSSVASTEGMPPADGPGSRSAPAGLKEEFIRHTAYTPPRTITLDNRFEGAVEVGVWSGYAVLVVSKTGKREVVVGPKTFMLEFNESLQPLEFSTSTPKTADKTFKTVYLRYLNNRVSDKVLVVTADNVELEVHLSHRVNFEGTDTLKWFEVENYIQFLCDHTRSLLRKVVKKTGIEAFYQNAIDIVRDAILGKGEADGKQRTGRKFDENGMRIYDVEVLDVQINNPEIADLLLAAQHKAVKNTLAIAGLEQDLELVRKRENVSRECSAEKIKTALNDLALEQNRFQEETALECVRAKRRSQIDETQKQADLGLQKLLDQIVAAELNRQEFVVKNEIMLACQRHDVALRQKKELESQELFVNKEQSAIDAAADKASAEALALRLQGFSEKLVAALQSFSDRDLAIKVAEAMAPLAILRDESVADSFVQMVKGTGLENIVKDVLTHLKPKELPESELLG